MFKKIFSLNGTVRKFAATSDDAGESSKAKLKRQSTPVIILRLF